MFPRSTLEESLEAIDLALQSGYGNQLDCSHSVHNCPRRSGGGLVLLQLAGALRRDGPLLDRAKLRNRNGLPSALNPPILRRAEEC